MTTAIADTPAQILLTIMVMPTASVPNSVNRCKYHSTGTRNRNTRATFKNFC